MIYSVIMKDYPHYIEYIRSFGNRFMETSTIFLPEPKQQVEMEYDVTHLDWKQLPDYESTDNTCVDVISSRFPLLINEFNPSDITFLAIDNTKGKSVVHKLKTQKNISVTHTFGFLPGEREEYMRKRDNRMHDIITDARYQRTQKMKFSIDINNMKATTIHSFKGWESPALVVQIERGKDGDGVPVEVTEEYIAMIYTALSRLRSGRNHAAYIYVICSDPIFEEYQKTWNL